MSHCIHSVSRNQSRSIINVLKMLIVFNFVSRNTNILTSHLVCISYHGLFGLLRALVGCALISRKYVKFLAGFNGSKELKRKCSSYMITTLALNQIWIGVNPKKSLCWQQSNDRDCNFSHSQPRSQITLCLLHEIIIRLSSRWFIKDRSK